MYIYILYVYIYNQYVDYNLEFGQSQYEVIDVINNTLSILACIQHKKTVNNVRYLCRLINADNRT